MNLFLDVLKLRVLSLITALKTIPDPILLHFEIYFVPN